MVLLSRFFSFLIFFGLVSPLWAAEPSFDCNQASNQIERLICQSDLLSLEDRKLAQLYRKALKQAAGDGQSVIRAAQRRWLAARNRDCKQPRREAEQCLIEAYHSRNAELAASIAFDSAKFKGSGGLKILRITPKGEDVAAGKQLVFQFDQPVVPIGRMERDTKDIPVSISPALNCEWRWLNTSALACQLREEDRMRKATRYRVEMRPGIRTEDGAQLAQAVKHEFITERPKVTYTRFFNWLSPGTPMMQLTFNQPVTRDSVQRSLHVDGVKVIAYPDNLRRELPWWMALTNESEQPTVDDQLSLVDGDEARRVWAIEPLQELPLDSEQVLEIQPGLVSNLGAEPGIESRVVIRFRTFPAFAFNGINCTLEGTTSSVRISPNSDAETLQKSRCAPLNAVSLVFSAPVLNSSIKDFSRLEPPLDGGRKDYDPWENVQDWTSLNRAHSAGREYYVRLPEFLRAEHKYRLILDREQLTDEFGRKLAADIDLEFHTAPREPKLRLVHQAAVLEKGVDSEVPLYVTNLDQVTINYDRLDSAGQQPGITKSLDVEQAKNIAFSMPMGVRELLDGNSGAIEGTLRPSPLPPRWGRDPSIFAQVTPFQVHFKAGHFNSLAWVSRFDSGELVADARVSLLNGYFDDFNSFREMGVSTTTDRAGMAILPGLAQFDPALKYINGGYARGYRPHPGLIVKVETPDDIALVPLNWDFAVHASGTYPSLNRRGGHSHSWGTTAQGVYKLGDKVQYKVYLREQSNAHWKRPRRKAYHLQVFDPKNKLVHERKDIELNPFGALDGEFKLAEQGSVGWYRFQLKPMKSTHQEEIFTWQPMSVLVSDFTPSPFKVSAELNGKTFKAGDKLEINTLASLHSGGAFTGADVRLNLRLDETAFSTTNPRLKNFNFGGKKSNIRQKKLLELRDKLNDRGEFSTSLTLPDTDIYFGSLSVESAVRDDRGKYIAASAAAQYAGRDRYVGLRNSRWLYRQGETENLQVAVVDSAGEFDSGVAVTVAIENREVHAARVKGPGNAFLTRNVMRWVEQARCQVSSALAPVDCEFTPQKPGYYRFVATIEDSKGRLHQSSINGWATGSGHVVWDQTDDANLQIIAEQSEYRIGDNARYLIKNPFPGAKALISVERYGVLDSWVQTLEGSTPIIEVPVKPDYLPGFYLSVVVVSPRVEKPPTEQQLDLGKPSYRIGYVKARVSDPYKELQIKVSTDRDEYKPGEMVKARIQVDRSNLTEDVSLEFALAVVDESVLALNRSGEKYYDPYEGFNRLDNIDLKNYSLISRLVGRQKFEKKGANPGGGGGSFNSRLRGQFKYVSYWNPSVEPGPDGEAEVEFSLPDNLTGWRIFALAVDKDDRMGVGDRNIKVNRPTEIRPVMPNQLTEGDNFKAGFTVMNRTEQSRRLQFRMEARGPLANATAFASEIELAPYQRKTIWAPLSTRGDGTIELQAEASDALDGDALRHSLPVHKRRSLETAANYGTITGNGIGESIKVPDEIFPDSGSVGVTLSPSVIGNIDGAVDYLNKYPHLCWEQRLSKSLGANAYVELQQYLDQETSWENPQTDIRKLLDSAANFQAPNGGMVYWTPSNQYVSPYLSAYTAMAFNWLRASGHRIPSEVEDKLDEYLLRLLRRDEFPSFYTKGMASSVRAVALAALAASGELNASDIRRYRSHFAEMDLFGKAHFLRAASMTDGVGKWVVDEALDSILGQSSQSGGKFQFNEVWDDSYKYILATPLRSNCAVLSSLLETEALLDDGAKLGDIPFKMVRSITQSRQNRDHWENTQENVFCLNALVDYARRYESVDPDMQVAVTLDGEQLGRMTFTSKADPLVEIKRPLAEKDVGQARNMQIDKSGAGRLYYSARLSYALREDNASRINSGIEVRREYSVERDGKFELLSSPMQIRRGELVRVDLYVSVPTARHFVAVHDPLPGGLEAVNTDLATASAVDAGKAEFKASEESWYYNFSDWTSYGRYFWSFYHKELRHDSARFYADYLPAGNYHLSYAAQAIAEGSFSVGPLHVEEMYDPDVYGKGLPASLNVTE